uniref:PDZ domain-containing protein n=1 Tax=Ciona savignyi TaxID=51511 RepID=H2Y4E3_CIOSA
MDKLSLGSRGSSPIHGGLLQVKSKFQAEFRRFPIDVERDTFDDFFHRLESLHHLVQLEFVITYTDPQHGDLLPINNDENFAKAQKSCGKLMRVYVHRKDNLNVMNGFGQSTVRRRKGKKTVPKISFPEDFRPVSAIIDVDILPDTLRRVRLHNHGINKPLGFFIRDGVSLRMSDNGLEKVPGIFISRLVQGGLAEMTGLLAVNDEVLEVNGIEVGGKSLDQVTDMMVANSSNLIITVKPASMKNTMGSTRSRSHERLGIHTVAQQIFDSEDEDNDVVKDLSSTKNRASDRSAKSSDYSQKNPKPSPNPSPRLNRSGEVISKNPTHLPPSPRPSPSKGGDSGRRAKHGKDSIRARRNHHGSNPNVSV